MNKEQKIRDGEKKVIKDMHSHVELLFQSDNEQVELAESLRGLRERKWCRWLGFVIYYLVFGMALGVVTTLSFRVWEVLLVLWKEYRR